MELFSRLVRVTINHGSSTQIIDGLDIDFETKTSRDSNENEATVNIYNLNDESRGRLAAKGPAVTLEVGHGDTLFTLFAGNISKVSHTHNGTNEWVAKLQLGDGNVARKDAKFSKTYAASSSATAIVADVAATFGASTVNTFTSTDILESSLTLDGKSSGIMDELAAMFSFDWQILQGVVEITPPKTPPITAGAIPLLTGDTGLLAPPERLDTGVRLRSIIIGGLRPNGLVAVGMVSTRSVDMSGGTTERESDISLNGTYLVDKVTTIGSTYDERFDAITEGLTQ